MAQPALARHTLAAYPPDGCSDSRCRAWRLPQLEFHVPPRSSRHRSGAGRSRCSTSSKSQHRKADSSAEEVGDLLGDPPALFPARHCRWAFETGGRVGWDRMRRANWLLVEHTRTSSLAECIPLLGRATTERRGRRSARRHQHNHCMSNRSPGPCWSWGQRRRPRCTGCSIVDGRPDARHGAAGGDRVDEAHAARSCRTRSSTPVAVSIAEIRSILVRPVVRRQSFRAITSRRRPFGDGRRRQCDRTDLLELLGLRSYWASTSRRVKSR